MTLYIPYFQPQVMVKFTRRLRGHFVTLTEGGMHLIVCSPGVISPKPSLILLARTYYDLKKHEVCIFSFSFSSFRAIRFNTAEQFFLVATRCSHGHRPLIFFITLLFTVLVVSCVCKCFQIERQASRLQTETKNLYLTSHEGLNDSLFSGLLS